MKHLFGRLSPALLVVLFVVAGCGQVTEGDTASLAVPRAAPRAPAQLLQADFCDDAETGCTPTGAHGALAVDFVTGHAGYECKECHYVGGRLAFKPVSQGGLAFLPAPGPRPYFDASSKTCSNVACHTVPAGTYSYTFPGGDGEPQLNTVSYGGGAPRPTPSWYATGASCSACHVSPPVYGGVPYAWHSGLHGGSVANNNCQICHLDAVSVYSAPQFPGAAGTWTAVGLSTATNCTVEGVPNQPCRLLHADGALNVNGRFTRTCFNCH